MKFHEYELPEDASIEQCEVTLLVSKLRLGKTKGEKLKKFAENMLLTEEYYWGYEPHDPVHNIKGLATNLNKYLKGIVYDFAHYLFWGTKNAVPVHFVSNMVSNIYSIRDKMLFIFFEVLEIKPEKKKFTDRVNQISEFVESNSFACLYPYVVAAKEFHAFLIEAKWVKKRNDICHNSYPLGQFTQRQEYYYGYVVTEREHNFDITQTEFMCLMDKLKDFIRTCNMVLWNYFQTVQAERFAWNQEDGK